MAAAIAAFVERAKNFLNVCNFLRRLGEVHETY